MNGVFDRSNLRNIIRRFWWVGVIVTFVLILLCVCAGNSNLLAKVFNPPRSEEVVTQAPTDVVTEPPKVVKERPTEPPTDQPTDGPTDKPTDRPTEVVTKPPTEPPTLVVTEAPTEPEACQCAGVDWVCPGQPTSYNSTQCGGSGQCGCRDPNKTWACPDGTYADFNPNCGVGGGGSPPGCMRTSCGNGVCEPMCGETKVTCPRISGGDC